MAKVKVQSYKVQKKGMRGHVITLPTSWTDDLRLRPGDRVDIYRDEEDRLILQACKKEEPVEAR